MGYQLARWIIKNFVRLTTRLEIEGAENLPISGNYVVASNHLGRLDPAMVYAVLERQDIIMFVAEKYERSPLWRWFAHQMDAIFIDRFNADFAAVRKALNRLRKGGLLVLAPEGTRSQTGALIEGKPGVSFLASKANVPIIPVALMGTEDKRVVHEALRLRRSKVIARIGLPFTLPPSRSQEREETLQQHTDEIMCQIAALLKPEYRGVYSDHPRLHQLLAERGEASPPAG
jgi:1-acyl-sn-glycerol-3-phosphate acyltransferase